MRTLKRIGLVATIGVASVGCDQATKAMAAQYLPRGEMLSFLQDTLRLGYTENNGAFLSLGSGLAPELRFWILVVGVGAFLAGIAGYLLMSKRQTLASIVGLSLLFSGGLSNFYDRVVNQGAVVDFLNVGIGPVRTGVFNIADVVIMAGLAVLLLARPKAHEMTVSRSGDC